jgi:hypothetical protein
MNPQALPVQSVAQRRSSSRAARRAKVIRLSATTQVTGGSAPLEVSASSSSFATSYLNLGRKVFMMA